MLGHTSLVRFGSTTLLTASLLACNGAIEAPGTGTGTGGETGKSGTGTGTGEGTSAPTPGIPTSPGNLPGLTNVPPTKIADPRGGGTPFHIVLSNQSFDVPVVDLRVSLDGYPVILGDFLVGSQHSFYTFDFSLAPGEHLVQISTTTGQAATTAKLSVEEGEERWGVSMYWTQGACGASPTGGEPCSKKVDWTLMDTQPFFD